MSLAKSYVVAGLSLKLVFSITGLTRHQLYYKPKGGIRGRVEATGRGVQYALQEAFRHPKDIEFAGLTGKLNGKKIVVQGLGNVGYHAAQFLSQEDGALIIGVLERDGAVYDEQGIDIDGLHKHI